MNVGKASGRVALYQSIEVTSWPANLRSHNEFNNDRIPLC